MRNREALGCECVFDGNRTGLIDDITEDGYFIIVDPDGGEHTIHRERVDHITYIQKHEQHNHKSTPQGVDGRTEEHPRAGQDRS